MRTGISQAIGFLLLPLVLHAPACGEDQPAPSPENASEVLRYLSLNGRGHQAPVRGLIFTEPNRLCSVGWDKVVRFWRIADRAADPTKGLQAEPTAVETLLRPSAGRGYYGQLSALAWSPASGVLAFGGVAVYAEDNIQRYDLRAEFLRPSYSYKAHDNLVKTLCFSADGQSLVSADDAGRTILWRGGDQPQPIVLLRPEKEEYAAALYAGIERWVKNRPLRPLAVAGNRWVLVPRCERLDNDGRPIWRIERFDAVTGRIEGSLRTEHYFAVQSMAASADGRFLAASDLNRKLYLWDLQEKDPDGQLLGKTAATSLAFGPQADRLAAGVEVGDGSKEVQIWDVPARKLLKSWPVPSIVYSVAISPDGKRLAYSCGNDIRVETLDRLAGPGNGFWIRGVHGIARVAFKNRVTAAHDYAVDFQLGSDGPWNSFQPAKVSDCQSLDETPAPAATPETRETFGTWTLTPNDKRLPTELTLSDPRGAKCVVRPDWQRWGRITAWCWIPDEQGQPAGVAVALDRSSEIYVYDLAAEGECPLRGYCRGHGAAVKSLAVSADRRYLVSGGEDGMLCYWSLDRFGKLRKDAGDVSAAWGAEFAVEGAKLVVKSVDDTGPLYRKGIRTGDVLTKLQWPDADGRLLEVWQPADVLAWLAEYARQPAQYWSRIVSFWPERAGKPRPGFNLQQTGWPPILSLYPMSDGEWIAWTSTGYYACSPKGERLIGWLINEGAGRLPAFHEAEDYHRVFNRPPVIEHLLEKGTVTDAFGAAYPPAPRIEIVSHQFKEDGTLVVDVPDVEIVARIEAAGALREVWLLRNGVRVPPDRQTQEPIGGGPTRAYTVRWKMSLTAQAAQAISISAIAERGGPPNASTRNYQLAYWPREYPQPQITILHPNFHDTSKCEVAAASQRVRAEIRAAGELLRTSLEIGGRQLPPADAPRRIKTDGDVAVYEAAWTLELPKKQPQTFRIHAEATRGNPARQVSSPAMQIAFIPPVRPLPKIEMIAPDGLKKNRILDVDAADVEVVARLETSGPLKRATLAVNDVQDSSPSLRKLSDDGGRAVYEVRRILTRQRRCRLDLAAEDADGQVSTLDREITFLPPNVDPKIEVLRPGAEARTGNKISIDPAQPEVIARITTSGPLRRAALAIDEELRWNDRVQHVGTSGEFDEIYEARWPLTPDKQPHRINLVAQAERGARSRAFLDNVTLAFEPRSIHGAPEPKVTIVAPTGTGGRRIRVEGPEVTITARVETAAELEQVSLVLNGANRDPKNGKDLTPVAANGDLSVYEVSWKVVLDKPEMKFSVWAVAGGVQRQTSHRILLCERPKSSVGNLYLLAVGVQQNQTPPGARERPVRADYADRDATSLAEVFQRLGSKKDVRKVAMATVLVNEQATRTAVLAGFEAIKRSRSANPPTSNDLVVLFLAGHGERDDDGQFYYLPYDGYSSDLRHTCISADDIKELAAKVPHLLVFLDTCHSGQAAKRLPGPAVSQLEQAMAETERLAVLVASCDSDQESYRWDARKRGIFTWYVDEGLTKEETASAFPRLYDDVAVKVKNEASYLYQKRQTPKTNYESTRELPEWARKLELTWPMGERDVRPTEGG